MLFASCDESIPLNSSLQMPTFKRIRSLANLIRDGKDKVVDKTRWVSHQGVFDPFINYNEGRYETAELNCVLKGFSFSIVLKSNEEVTFNRSTHLFSWVFKRHNDHCFMDQPSYYYLEVALFVLATAPSLDLTNYPSQDNKLLVLWFEVFYIHRGQKYAKSWHGPFLAILWSFLNAYAAN